MRKTTHRWPALGPVVFLLALSACSNDRDGAQVGGHTNWLPCQDITDCGDHPEATACEDGYCVDRRGQRVAARATASAEDAGHEGMDASLDMRDGGAEPSDSGDAGSSPQSGDGGGGGDASTGGASTGDASAGDASTGDASASVPDAALSGQPCGPTLCPPASHCCDACLGICIPEGSGAACPGGAPGTLCRDGGIADVRLPQCPGSMERCASENCFAGMTCVSCPMGQVCLELNLSCGPQGGVTAQCIDWPCGDTPLSTACANAVCRTIEPSGLFPYATVHGAGSPLRPGDAPILGCAGGGVCAAPNTPIATPHGELPIAELRQGDLVYSLHAGQIRAVPLIAIARTPVFDHRVVRLALDNGAQLEVSAPHPLADGRPLGALRAGEQLDGHTVVVSEAVDYSHPYTHDVLPASDSGTYLAAGVWLRSTLH